jgi:hypothetical protein
MEAPKTLAEKLEFLENLEWQLSAATRTYTDSKEAILSPVQELLDELDAEQGAALEALKDQVTTITAQVKFDAMAEFEKHGTKEVSTRNKLVRIQQSGTTWDTVGLEALANEVPAILRYRREGTFYAKFGAPKQ